MNWNNDQLFSSERHDWATPWPLFLELDNELGPFTLDAAASPRDTKCEQFMSEVCDSLTQDWYEEVKDGGAVWLNPPYGRSIDKWIKKAYHESLMGCRVVVLTMARTDTKWWKDWAMKAAEIRFITGRIKFIGAESSAPAPSCVLIFDEKMRVPKFTITSELPRR